MPSCVAFVAVQLVLFVDNFREQPSFSSAVVSRPRRKSSTFSTVKSDLKNVGNKSVRYWALVSTTQMRGRPRTNDVQSCECVSVCLLKE